MSRLGEMGEYSAERVPSSTYKAYARSGNFIGFLENKSRLHRQFYSLGQQTATVASGGHGCRIEVTAKPVYPKADQYIAAGFYASAAQVPRPNRSRRSFQEN